MCVNLACRYLYSNHVIMTKQEFFELADRYSMYQCTEEEKKLYEDFCNQMSDQDALKSWDMDEMEATRIRLLSNLDARMSINEVPQKQSWKPVLSIAASVVLILGMAWFFYQQNQAADVEQPSVQLVEKQTRAGQKLSVTLPDGSKVRLNAESEISYFENFSKSSREVHLKGEAFFEVVKNPKKPFRVITEGMTTTVLGTSFNVDAYEQTEKVTVATGKVEVALRKKHKANGTKVYITPKEQAAMTANGDGLMVNTVELEDILAWKENKLVFRNVSLLEASQELEKWFGVEINFANDKIKECKFSNVYSNEALENILKELKFILNVEYEMSDNNTITLTGSGCSI